MARPGAYLHDDLSEEFWSVCRRLWRRGSSSHDPFGNAVGFVRLQEVQTEVSEINPNIRHCQLRFTVSMGPYDQKWYDFEGTADEVIEPQQIGQERRLLPE